MTKTQLKDAPKAGTKAFVNYKAGVCEHALRLKKKIEKLQSMLDETKEVLDAVFDYDGAEFFSNLGWVKKESSNSYSVDESKISDLKKKIDSAGLTIDDYINQKTTWGITPKLRAILKSEDDLGKEIAPLIKIDTRESLTIKTS